MLCLDVDNKYHFGGDFRKSDGRSSLLNETVNGIDATITDIAAF
jgi:hypothetical protein